MIKKPAHTKRPRLDRPVYFRASAELFAALERVAVREQRTIASVIRIAVEQYVKRGEK
jgi:predicted transcriptional regulator